MALENGVSWINQARRRAPTVMPSNAPAPCSPASARCSTTTRAGRPPRRDGPQPLRVVVDSRLRRRHRRSLLAPPGVVLIYAAQPQAERGGARRGAEIALSAGAGGRSTSPPCWPTSRRGGINELHVEAGHKLNGSLVREGLVDEFLVYMAPRLLASARAGRLRRLDAPGGHAGPALDEHRAHRRRPAPDRPGAGPRRLLTRRRRRSLGAPATITPMFTGIISGVGRIVDAKALGADAGTASA